MPAPRVRLELANKDSKHNLHLLVALCLDVGESAVLLEGVFCANALVDEQG